MRSLRVISPEFNLLGEIDEYQSFELSKCWGLSGTCRLVAPYSDKTKEMLVKNAIVFNDTKKGYIIVSVEQVEADEESSLICLGKSLDGILERRITLQANYTNLPKETIIKDLIEKNMTNAANPDRNIGSIQIAIDQERGARIDFATEKKNLLTEVEQICIDKDISLTTEIDLANKKIIVDVSEGLDRTHGNFINPQAVFSRSFDNLKSSRLTDSDINKATVVYLETQSFGDASGLERFEMVSSKGDLSEAEAARIFLSENKGERSVECEVASSANLVYGESYELGDIVTIIIQGAIINTRLVEVIERYEAGNVGIDLVFGNKGLTLTQLLKKKT